VLLGLFTVLVVIRAFLVARRNITLSQLEAGFLETVRARLTKRLAAAPWPVVSRLQHARVTHLLSGDIHQISAATQYMVQFAATVVLVLAQMVIAFWLAPLPTAVALFLIAIGAAAGFAMLRRAHDFGTELTGASKSTFADLLVGLLEPDSGEITVGGTRLRGAAGVKWRDHVSYVVQDTYLFRDTIRRNLLWANPQASEAEIWDALVIAEAAAFVDRLKDGLDTVLGERGVLISGGERQRLCLARAALRRPWLFVLDEATSAIDVATEHKILKRMLELDPRPTIVMIAHRDQSLAYCDRVLRFETGRFVTDESPVTV